MTDLVQTLAGQLLAGAALPSKAAEDALHIAVAAIHNVEYRLTWNCRHIANAPKRLALHDLRAIGLSNACHLHT